MANHTDRYEPAFNEMRFIPESMLIVVKCTGYEYTTVDMSYEIQSFVRKLVDDNPYAYGTGSYPELPRIGIDQYAGFVDYLIEHTTGIIHECICNIVNS